MPNTQMDDLVEAAGDHGFLDLPEVREGSLSLHNFLRDAGVDPNVPETYETAIAVISLLSALSNEMAPLVAMEWAGRFVLRSYRDLPARG